MPSSVQLSGENAKYKLLVQVLTSDPRFAKALADVTSPSQHEKLSKALVGISWPVQASMTIIYALIQLEFQRKYKHPFTILRVNSIVSKMMGKFTGKVGTEYLNIIIGDLIREVVDQEDLSLEVDAARLDGDEDQAKENLNELDNLCQRFIDTITSDDKLEQMPRELRAICRYITVMGDIFNLDYEEHIRALISGFLMLRYICPCITLPHIASILPKIPPSKIRKNLTNIARVLQKLANGEKFDSATPHLLPMNDFIERNTEKLSNWLKAVCKDPMEDSLEKPFSDMNKVVSYEDLHFKEFELEDLQLLHTLIFQYQLDLIVSVQNEVMLTEDRRPISIISSDTEFLKVIKQLGPPPKGTDTGEEDKEEKLIDETISALSKHFDKFDLGDLERARFFYKGKPDKNGIPIFYLILHRIRFEFLHLTDLLLVHIHKVLGESGEKPFNLIIDLSFMDTGEESVAAFYRCVISLSRIVRRALLSNIKQVYLVHPTNASLDAMHQILAILPEETYTSLIRYAYQWSYLGEIISTDKIWIPFISKKFVPLAFRVKQQNNQRAQDRLLKVAPDSLLIIDIKSQNIAKEILFSTVNSVKIEGDNKFTLNITPATWDHVNIKGEGYFFEVGGDSTFTFECLAKVHREVLVEMILDYALRESCNRNLQAFPINKNGQRSRKRKLRLTTDSILLVHNNSIAKEIPFSTIDAFYIIPNQHNFLKLLYTVDGSTQEWDIETEDTKGLRTLLLDAQRKFKFSKTIEIEVFSNRGVDEAMNMVYQTMLESASGDTIDLKQITRQIWDLFKSLTDSDKIERTAARDGLQEKFDLSSEQAAHVIGKINWEHRSNLYLSDFVEGLIYTDHLRKLEKKRQQAQRARG
eukprot:gb/GECH01001574.1/.p1 GENE.gb/GECH01001574.1/~~gb/GECH01001574.1/.p1  ORF type:complete len:868 (+),score=182.47 gb/GECH01001574.1/:1-2604(+)